MRLFLRPMPGKSQRFFSQSDQIPSSVFLCSESGHVVSCLPEKPMLKSNWVQKRALPSREHDVKPLPCAWVRFTTVKRRTNPAWTIE
jgi:hypothetical protein